MSFGRARVWRATSDRGRAYSVLQAGTCPLGCQCGPPSIGHSRTCLHNGEGESVSYLREMLTHRKLFDGKIFHECLS
jgi:hypothetical protein